MSQKKKSYYATIAEDILEKIKDDTYKTGSLLPPERVFMDIYSTQRTTVRRALELLKKDGHINKVAGLGSVVVSKTKVETSIKECEDNTTQTQIVTTSKISKILILVPDNREYRGYENIPVVKETLDKLSSVYHKNSIEIIQVSSENIDEISSFCKSNGKKGCVVFEYATDSVLSMLKDANISVCFALSHHPDYRSVCFNANECANKAISILNEWGHSDIAFIGGQKHIYFENSLKSAFSTALSNYDIEENPDFINLDGNDEKAGFDRFAELFRRHGRKFTCVCAINDEVAKGAMKAAKYYDLSVPQDVSIVSLCSTQIADNTSGALVSCENLANECLLSVTSNTSYGAQVQLGCKVSQGTSVDTAKVQSTEKKLSDFLL